MYNAKGSFARKQLEKHGWSEGSGLGTNQQGISQSIKVKIKQDTTGVGHDPAKEFTDHWWDHLYNKAAAGLIVEENEEGVVLKKKKVTQKERAETAKKTLYSNFVKSSLLNDGKETKVQKEGGDSDSSEDEVQTPTPTLLLPDEELLKICGGRTCHKGARHGLRMSGKLARIEEQERLLAEKNNSSSTKPLPSTPPSAKPLQNGGKHPDLDPCDPDELSPSKRKKKCKKRKREEEDDKSEGRVDVCDSKEGVCSQQSEDSVSSSKKKRKKEKRSGSESRDSFDKRKEKGKKSKKKKKSKDNDC
ncbi:hypothetical protein ACOMHN_041447 [Nucella lapillus]